MKKLSELYKCNFDVLIKGIKINPLEVMPGDLFVCTTGSAFDRHDYLGYAIKKGAVAAVVSRNIKANIPIIRVRNTNRELPKLMEKFYDYPCTKLTMIGLTGTSGKTTTATLVKQILEQYENTGFLTKKKRSTNKNSYSIDNIIDNDKLYFYLDEFVRDKCQTVIMEISSEDLLFKRIGNIKYQISALTNITEEHLNIHKTLDNYIAAKGMLFENTDGPVILNIDDDYYEQILEKCHSEVVTYGKKSWANLYFYDIKTSYKETSYALKYDGIEYNIKTNLIGEINVYNLTCAIAILITYGLTMEQILPYTNSFKIKSNFEIVENKLGKKIILDNAQTLNALLKVFQLADYLKEKKLIVVIGDISSLNNERRLLINDIISTYADCIVWTKECLSLESNQVKNKYILASNEIQAIKKAIDIAGTDDIVLVLESYVTNKQALNKQENYLALEISKIIKEMEETKNVRN